MEGKVFLILAFLFRQFQFLGGRGSWSLAVLLYVFGYMRRSDFENVGREIRYKSWGHGLNALQT